MLRKLAALAVTALLLGAGLAGPTAAQDAYAGQFVSRTNSERQAKGLRAYVVKADLARVAARHSRRMADKNALYHNPNLGAEVDGWQVVGENVGSGGSVQAIHAAFMNSPKHRDNILAKDYTEIGVATVTDARGVIWVTQVFRLPYRAPKPTLPVRQPAAPRSVVRVVVPPPRPVAVAPRAVPAPPVVLPKAAAPVPVPVVDRPSAAAFATALAPERTRTHVVDPFALATAYARTMSALSR